ncbi:MAG: lysophospholipid transporter LplT [Sulfurimicrobium sp.]|jgi:MFS family permease|nr:lysophospholipid transporter LplT [Sulfurimicrobium sp.]MDO9189544.1 lysophospholipid transporter LplT [Sulfurimicrobium sp.]MDP1704114.1 lysophospholipid transporter LplT [Sulfurimicrobium sp.]MDP2199330.1 lysophospholipid transporter LplT [Sulfurimicrobium sp.]MDP2963746.1 lysophospholipid transporter LplT [Sulfurimicrobium sp.]
MNLGFYIILTAQFLSALADNALLFAAIALLKELSSPDWHTPLLQQFFVVSYILLAPFVGAFADAIPKGRVMFISNSIKFIGCLAMLFGMPPLYAYGIVGLGAAAYSPAKYGILTEYLPPNKLVLANSWMEGATVAAIVLGAIIGGILLNPALSSSLLAGWNLADSVSVSKFAVIIVTFLYISAAVFNLFIPRVAIDHKLPKKNPFYLLHDFWHSFILLWRDPQGQISLAVTTLFWGAGATLRLVVLTWAGLILKFDLEKATQLTAVVAVGIAVGAVVAGKFITLERSVKVLPTGILMGFTVMSMVLVDDWRIAVGLLFVIGALGGFFVVPMNALLQHRGHLLMGAGHSIAVQNFNENISILLLLGCYAMMVKSDMHINTITIAFGAFVSLSMWLINHRYKRVTAS